MEIIVSKLFYSNLEDIPGIKTMRHRAVSSLREFKDYLYNSLRNLKNQTYFINWELADSEQIARDYIKLRIPNNLYEVIFQQDEIKITLKKKEFDGKQNVKIINQREIKKIIKKTQDKVFPTRKYKEKHWIILQIPDSEDGSFIIKEFLNSEEVFQNKRKENEKKPRLESFPKIVRVLDSIPGLVALCLDSKPISNKPLYIRPSLYQLQKQIDAIDELQSRPKKHHRPLLRLLESIDKVRWPNFMQENVNQWEKLNDYNYPDTTNQQEFIQKSLGTPDFAFLEGPPGSGKTFSICELIIQLIRSDKKVLLVGSTHVAVDNVLEQLIEYEKEIFPIRIGKESRISEKIQPYQLQNRVKTIRNQLENGLLGIKKRSESQQYLLEAIQHKDPKIISNLIIKTSNLICGTTIGILKHPDFMNNRKSAEALFDVMILDEASKTPFTEFLVPALYAKKWILVGDIKQLSPYVEQKNIESNINGLLNLEEDKRICTDIFYLKKNLEKWEKNFDSKNFGRKKKKPKNQKKDNLYKMLVISDDKELLIKYAKQSEFLEVPYVISTEYDVNDETSSPVRIVDYFSSVLFLVSKSTLEKIEKYLPMDINLIRGVMNGFYFNRKRIYFFQNQILNNNRGIKFLLKTRKIWNKLPNFTESEDDSNDFGKKWDSEVAWRSVRAYEVKENEKNSNFYKNEINKLLPVFVNEKHFQKIKDHLELVGSVSFPSFLELVQVGYERSPYLWVPTTLSDSFPKVDFNKRHSILNFQFRMHPQISEFPREHFYKKNDALRNTGFLNRQWGYSRYKNRSVWVTYAKKVNFYKNVNKKEVQILMEELKNFCKWAKSHPKENAESSNWEGAILTFYLGQENAIRSELRKFFKTNGYQNFKSENGFVDLTLCTVDRFQGHEADIVFLSFVRTQGAGFLNNPNRLNVALTRARYQLVLIGYVENFRRLKRDIHLKALADEIPVEYDLSKI